MDKPDAPSAESRSPAIDLPISRARRWLSAKLEQGDVLDLDSGMTADDLFALVEHAERTRNFRVIPVVPIEDAAAYVDRLRGVS
ncbi:MAG TPA: hypothetical protein VF592_03735 [Sphingomonas sp.]|jgi:hypothetical protein|uniref:hypothetical protein n=1 Tax=Sphingomonas sp. TaxID=28214 RepID=UPI002EDA345E